MANSRLKIASATIVLVCACVSAVVFGWFVPAMVLLGLALMIAPKSWRRGGF
jgi:hypothetical protein